MFVTAIRLWLLKSLSVNVTIEMTKFRVSKRLREKFPMEVTKFLLLSENYFIERFQENIEFFQQRFRFSVSVPHWNNKRKDAISWKVWLLLRIVFTNVAQFGMEYLTVIIIIVIIVPFIAYTEPGKSVIRVSLRGLQSRSVCKANTWAMFTHIYSWEPDDWYKLRLHNDGICCVQT